MLSNGSRIAPSACLRCQLAQVIRHIPRTPLPLPPPQAIPPTRQSCRHFSCSPQAWQDYVEDELLLQQQTKHKPYRTKHINLTGRIVGRPGRRQREVSERLATTSLGRPADVIVLRDVARAQQGTWKRHELVVPGNGAAPEPAKEEDVEAGADVQFEDQEDTVPEESEVNASINTLKPANTVVELPEFEEVVRNLVDGYNVQQLSHYFDAKVSAELPLDLQQQEGRHLSISHGSYQQMREALRRTPWRPGKTPISKRHGSKRAKPKPEAKNAKQKLAEQIVRDCWDVSIHSERELVGELELYVKPWQITLLFDQKRIGRVMAEALLDSQLLARSSKIQPYRSDNVVRITARQQDAEEIARQLEQKLHQVNQVNVDFNLLRKRESKSISKRKAIDLFQPEDLEEISALTQAVFDFESDWKVVIWAFRKSNAFAARRSLLSLLELPCPSSEEVHLKIAEVKAKGRGRKAPSMQNMLLPVPSASGIPRSHRHHDWYRLCTPLQRLQPKAQSQASEMTGSKVILLPPDLTFLMEQNKADPTGASNGSMRYGTLESDNDSSYWNAADIESYSTIRLELGQRLVRHTKPSSTYSPQKYSTSAGQPSTFASYQAHSAVVLSYFTPLRSPASISRTDAEAPGAHLELQFMPSPFASKGLRALEELPRIKLLYGRPSSNGNHTGSFTLLAVQAVLQERRTSIPLPDRAVDLRIVEEAHLTPSMDKFAADEQVQDLTRTLNNSIMEGFDGFLNPKQSIIFKLPACVVEKHNPAKAHVSPKDANAWEGMDVHYLFEKFELRRAMDFEPDRQEHDTANTIAVDDESMNTALRSIALSAQCLRLVDIHGGALEGRRQEMSIVAKDRNPQAAAASSTSPRDHDRERLVRSGLHLADAITRAAAGDLKILRRDPSRKAGATQQREDLRASDEDDNGPILEPDVEALPTLVGVEKTHAAVGAVV